MSLAIVPQADPAAVEAAAEAGVEPGGVLSRHDVFVRVGLLTRNLHDALRELGYDQGIEQAVGALPDARARLDYVASLTGRAAERVLAATERAKAGQEAMRAELRELHARWEQALVGDCNAAGLSALGHATKARIGELDGRADAVNDELTEIILAQDFHDLTGQVIQRITRIAQTLEEQLVKLLLDASPSGERRAGDQEALAGPVIAAAGRQDVVTSQAQVDDLLESMGF